MPTALPVAPEESSYLPKPDSTTMYSPSRYSNNRETDNYSKLPLNPEPNRVHQVESNLKVTAPISFAPNQLMDTASQYNYLQPGMMSGLNEMPGLINKANLNFEGNIMDIVTGWSEEETNLRRRLVQFWRRHENNNISCTFRAIAPSTKPPNSTVISCIYWEDKQEYFVTSVDCIQLLESLISVRFTVEEKNRIRRNLEGFRPLTVSKCKQDTADFFKLIMAFPNPKPRNIEKDVKVFPWKVLTYALKKIVSKYATGLTQGISSNLPFNHPSEMKYEPPANFNPYSVGGYQNASIPRRYSQPANMVPMNMYPQQDYMDYTNKSGSSMLNNMAPIPERATIDEISRNNNFQQSLIAQQNAFVRRHSMADPYSMQRLHRPSDSNLPKLDEDGQQTNLYSLVKMENPQSTGLGISNNNPLFHNESSSRHF